MEDLPRQGPGLGQSLEGAQQRRRRLRQRQESRRDFGDHPQGPPGADHQLGHVVSGYVLHGLPAEGHDIAVGVNGFEPQQQIPGGTVEIPPRSAAVGGDDAADGRLIRIRADPGAGTNPCPCRPASSAPPTRVIPAFHGKAQVGNVVLGDPVDPQHGQNHIHLSGNPARGHFGAVAPGHNGQFFRMGIGQQLRYLFHTSGGDDGLGRQAVDGIGLELIRILDHMGFPDDPLQGGNQLV